VVERHRRRLAVAQECSDSYYCQPPPQSEIPENDQIRTNSGLLEVRRNVTAVRLTI
jgi:hypothetical protein